MRIRSRRRRFDDVRHGRPVHAGQRSKGYEFAMRLVSEQAAWQGATGGKQYRRVCTEADGTGGKRVRRRTDGREGVHSGEFQGCVLLVPGTVARVLPANAIFAWFSDRSWELNRKRHSISRRGKSFEWGSATKRDRRSRLCGLFQAESTGRRDFDAGLARRCSFGKKRGSRGSGRRPALGLHRHSHQRGQQRFADASERETVWPMLPVGPKSMLDVAEPIHFSVMR